MAMLSLVMARLFHLANGTPTNLTALNGTRSFDSNDVSPLSMTVQADGSNMTFELYPAFQSINTSQPWGKAFSVRLRFRESPCCFSLTSCSNLSITLAMDS